MDERAAKRVAVDLDLDAQIAGASVGVHVYDLSMDGCSIEAEASNLPAPGALITLKFLHNIEVVGTLEWVKRRNGGVQFTERLPALLVQELGFAHSSTGLKGFQDQFGRSHTIPGQRFDVTRDHRPDSEGARVTR